MPVLKVMALLWLATCCQAARDEADGPEDALRSLGGLLQKYVVSAHSREATKDPGLNLTVQQSVTLHHDGTGTTISRQQSNSNDKNTTGSSPTELVPKGSAPVTEASGLAPSKGYAPFTVEGVERNTARSAAYTPAEELLRDRSILGPITPDEDDPEAQTRAWNPDAMCDGMAARHWADIEKKEHQLSEWKARQVVMEKYSRKFHSWNPYRTIVSVTGEKAQDRAQKLKARGLTLDAARQLVMYEFPEKFSIGGTACAWVVDGGSSGARLYQFTEFEFCPEPVVVPLKCEKSRDTHGMIAFSPGDTSKGKVLRFRDIIGAQADVDPEDMNTWLKEDDIMKSRSTLVDCYAYSLAATIKENDKMCSRTSLYIGVTAGFRDFWRNATDEQQGRIRIAQDSFNNILQMKLKIHAPRTKMASGGLQVLSIQREGSMEAKSVEVAAQVCGDDAVKDAIGVFSMGGKSAQFTSFRSERYTLNMQMGHLRAVAILQKAFQDKIYDAKNLRAKFSAELLTGPYSLEDAKTERAAPDPKDFSSFTNGLWIGIQGTAWAAKHLGILGEDERHDPVSYEFVQEKIDNMLNSKEEWSAVADSPSDSRDLAQTLLLDFWLKNIFTTQTRFYFRKEWKTKSGRCLAAEWTFDTAKDTQPMLLQTLQDEAAADH